MRKELIAFAPFQPCAWLLGALAVLAVCTAQPAQATEGGPAPATAATAPVTPPGPAAATATATTPVPAAAPNAPAAPAAETATADGMREIPSGYRRVKRKGQEVYCRKVTTIGTRIAGELCFTREQLEDIASRTDSAMDDLNQGIKVCAGGGACQYN